MLRLARVKAVVLVNPNAGAMRRDPGLATAMRASCGNDAEVHVTRDPAHLASVASELAERGVEHVGVVGGDGTASASLTALAHAYGSRPLPSLTMLRGGTQNTIASSLGAKRASPLRLLRGMLRELSGRTRPAMMQRPCLQVGDRLGFLFGTGVMAGYLDVYNRANGGRPTPLTAATVLAHAAASALVNGSKIQSILNETELEVRYEGGHYESAKYVTIGASTVPHLGLGFRLFFRAFESQERFHLVAVHGKRPAVAAELPRVFAGLGLSSKVARQTLTRRAEISSPNGPFLYFVDGDLYTAPGSVSVGLGPIWTFLHPKPI